MKLSLNWLKEFVEINETPERISELITMHIAEVEGFENQAESLKHIVVGKVLEAKRHPNADNLNIGQFDVGEDNARQIVFGGKAVLKAGDMIPVALPGAHIGEITISERKLRNEISQGMCCLNSEIGILDNEEKLHFFDNSVTTGTPISEVLKLNDVIIEIDNKTLTHRSDLFNHVGFAREIAVVLQKELNIPALLEAEQSDEIKFTVEVEDPKSCPRYMGVVLNNIKIKSSPDWMQARLVSVGVRPINNVVDITNYVMMEYGQPLHAFDFDKLNGNKIIVRRAKKDELFVSLDNKNHKLDENTLVIADDNNPTALAGIMGGLTSEISDKTTTMALESANFEPTIIRKASSKQSLRTEASTRHEKGLGFIFPELGFWRAIELLVEHANAKVASSIKNVNQGRPQKKEQSLSLEFIERLIGMQISREKINEILTGLSFEIINDQEGVLTIEVPDHRTDISNEQDLIEEIARMIGYDAIPVTPLLGLLEPSIREKTTYIGEQLIHQLSAWGAREVMNYSFYGTEDVEKLELSEEKHIEIVNPMNPDQQYMRQTLLAGLLKSIKYNQDNQYKNISLVEYGHVFFPNNEFSVVAGVISLEDNSVFYKAKGLVEELLIRHNIKVLLKPLEDSDERENTNYQVFNPAADAIYTAGKSQIATIGLIKQNILDKYDISGSIAFFTIHLPRFVELSSKTTKFKKINLLPKIDLDISIEVTKEINWNMIQAEIVKSAGKYLESAELFDVYEGDKIDENKKSLGIRMFFQAKDRTLTMNEAEKIRTNIVDQLSKKFNAIHRF
ncbi:MAG: phenylalanine--tRNA ligase subunit beta [bacterium]|nr:phenylalanine--tRNA ligase subunit beta [bacterium]